MSDKLTGIPETLLIALWARAAATEEQAPIIRDDKAREMVAGIDYDFTKFDKSRFSKLGVAVRTMLLDQALGRFLAAHPDALVVNFGAGLDTRHARMGCDDFPWYEIDVPESIALRRKFFTETDKYVFIPQSMFDLSWADTIDAKGKRVLFLAEGLFMYFPESEVKPFFRALAQRFPGAEMVFEMLAPFLVGKSKRHESLGKMDQPPEFKWGLKNCRDMEGWHPGIRFMQEWDYYDYYKNRWGLLGLFGRSPFIRPRLSCRIVHLRFEELNMAAA